ncbi:MAG TPA: biotin/lipoyl-containing protein, partial [Solirubrobacterales bacterium]|nr:biotin/lipoyl-containing protein [Solirubrobacterales bacterium]
MSEIVMPRLSDSMEEGTILTWMKQVGDEVAVGDELVEIETDKANMAYEADIAGTLTEILAQEGDTLPIGAPIARIGGEGEAAPAPPAEEPESEPEPTPEPTPVSKPEKLEGERVKASPLARRLAKEKGIDLSAIAGSGP